MVGKAAQQVTRRARELLAPFGVTPVQYAALKVLSGSDGMSGAQIGGRMVLDSASITGVVDRLAALGLVERRADSRDRRVHRIVATPRAEALIGSLDTVMDQLNAEAMAVLGGPNSTFFRRLRQLGDEKNWNRDV
jgi:DNA-binding MarR family transcriptional regulator